MQGITNGRLWASDSSERGITQIDIHPDKPASEKDFFGKDGLSFRDVLDAVNPLNHIPIVSDIMKAQTGHAVSTASRLVGGTLLGGPIGFVASLASVIFEDATGASPVEAAYATLTGDDSVAVANNAAEAATQLAQVQGPPDLRMLEPALETAMLTAPALPAAPQGLPIARSTAPKPLPGVAPGGKAVLDLYGSSADSAHRSYRNAQFLPYLREVNKGEVL